MSLMSLFRPMTPAELVQWTLRIYARHWRQWLLLAALTVIPLLIANEAIVRLVPIPDVDPAVINSLFSSLEQGATPGAGLSDEDMRQVLASSMGSLEQAMLLALARVVIVGVIAGGAGAVLTSAAYHGEATSLGQALRVGLVERGGLLLRGHLTLGGLVLMMFLASVVGLTLCVGVLGLGLTVYLYLAWVPLLAPVLALGDGSFGDLTRQAWRFGKLRVWLLFAAVITLLVLPLLLGIPFNLIASLAGGADPVILMLSIVAEVLILPLGVIFYTLVYEDTRARLDGAAAPLAPAGLDAAAARPREPFLSAADVPNVVGVSMAALGLAVVFYLLVFFQVLGG